MASTFRDFNNMIAGVQAREKQRAAAEHAAAIAEKDKKHPAPAATAKPARESIELKANEENKEPFRIEDMAELQVRAREPTPHA